MKNTKLAADPLMGLGRAGVLNLSVVLFASSWTIPL